MGFNEKGILVSLKAWEDKQEVMEKKGQLKGKVAKFIYFKSIFKTNFTIQYTLQVYWVSSISVVVINKITFGKSLVFISRQ